MATLAVLVSRRGLTHSVGEGNESSEFVFNSFDNLRAVP